jgi:hypothetical protein
MSAIRYPSKHYPALNRCAYCPSTENLTKEHIIARGLGSNLVLPMGSCEAHRKATCKVEDFVLRKYLCAFVRICRCRRATRFCGRTDIRSFSGKARIPGKRK